MANTPDDAGTASRRRLYQAVALSTLALSLIVIFGTVLPEEPSSFTLGLFVVGITAALASTAWLARGATTPGAVNEVGTGARELARGNAENLSSMVHDIRNPVATIVSAMDLLSDAPDVGPGSRELIDAVSRSARLLSSLVLDHLDSARLDAGAIEVVPRAVRLDTLLRDASREVQPDADGKQVELSIEDAPGVFVSVEATSTARVLSNVLAHSIQLTASGGRIDVSVDAKRSSLALRVERGGVSVGGEEAAQLFERERHLDLYVAKRLAEANGGSVSLCADSPTAFAIVLPLSVAA